MTVLPAGVVPLTTKSLLASALTNSGAQPDLQEIINNTHRELSVLRGASLAPIINIDTYCVRQVSSRLLPRIRDLTGYNGTHTPLIYAASDCIDAARADANAQFGTVPEWFYDLDGPKSHDKYGNLWRGLWESVYTLKEQDVKYGGGSCHIKFTRNGHRGSLIWIAEKQEHPERILQIVGHELSLDLLCAAGWFDPEENRMHPLLEGHARLVEDLLSTEAKSHLPGYRKCFLQTQLELLIGGYLLILPGGESVPDSIAEITQHHGWNLDAIFNNAARFPNHIGTTAMVLAMNKYGPDILKKFLAGDLSWLP